MTGADRALLYLTFHMTLCDCHSIIHLPRKRRGSTMFQSRMLRRTALVIATGLTAALGLFPSVAFGTQVSHSQTTQSTGSTLTLKTPGGPWCC